MKTNESMPLFDSLPVVELKRLGGQNAAIYERLKRGPATNDELAKISRKYTSRISDLRAKGFVIECVDHNHETGVTKYQLKQERE